MEDGFRGLEKEAGDDLTVIYFRAPHFFYFPICALPNSPDVVSRPDGMGPRSLGSRKHVAFLTEMTFNLRMYVSDEVTQVSQIR